MIAPCKTGCGSARQHGAALIIALTLIAAVALLAATAIQNTVIESAMTRHLAMQASARLAAFSALERVQDEANFPLSGELIRIYELEHPVPLEAAVTVRFLGTSTAGTPDTQNQPETTIRHYDLMVEVTGPQNLRHRRKLYRQIQ